MSEKRGCPKCGGTCKLTLDEFIEKANYIHKYKYDYSKVEYVNFREKICIICPEHGEFWQTPHAHLSGQGCYECHQTSWTTEKILNKFKEIHGDKYDYSKFIYNGYEVKSCIICPEHGEFWQTPHAHLRGQGCYECYQTSWTTEKILNKFKEIHGDKYDYSKVDYVNVSTKVCIICPEHRRILAGATCTFNWARMPIL